MEDSERVMGVLSYACVVTTKKGYNPARMRDLGSFMEF